MTTLAEFEHSFNFDPSYGYDLERLRAVSPPVAPNDFAEFWQRRYRRILALEPEISLQFVGVHAGFNIYDIQYSTTDSLTIGGWLLEPERQTIHQAIVVGHGYGGRDQPDFHFGIPNTAFLFPCFRGLSRSRCPTISDQPGFHVLHHIDDRDRYVLGGCVDDLWLAISVMLARYPDAADRIGYMGISFGGGIGALALPWDQRVAKVHLNIPTFGHQPLRMELPSAGSANAVQNYARDHGNAADTLAYYDAAVAASHARQPLLMAAALFDPFVAPPGQFAIFNAWDGPKTLVVVDAGHFDYPNRPLQEQRLVDDLQRFFGVRSG